MPSQLPISGSPTYDQLQSWTGHPAAVIKCTIQDVYEASTIRRNHSYAEPIFLLDQCPFRNVDIVGWISSLSYVPVERDHDNPTMRLVMSVDDGNGSYVLPVSKTLKHQLVDRKHQAPVRPLLYEPARSGERYIPIADRQKREIKEAKANTKSKRHFYPDINVGDIVRIRGRMKEWSRRNGEIIREVVVDQDGGFISPATAWDEQVHFEEVERRKREIYSVEFQADVYMSMLAPLQPIASQIRATQHETQKTTQNATASSQLSVFDPSGNSSAYNSSASQPNANLRHPCKLSRDHLNDSQFRRYLMEYLRIQTENHWCADLESERAIKQAVRYMPELAWPTREVAAYQAEVERQKRKKAQMFEMDDLRDLEATPRAGRGAGKEVFRDVERRRPLTPVKFNGRRLESQSGDTESQDEGSNCAFGIEHLVHVPHLRIFAHRFVRLEQGKENELYMARRQELKAAGKSMSQQASCVTEKGKRPAYGSIYRDSRARRAERGWKMRKLFQHCFRLMVGQDGSVVEVEMSERDRAEIRADAERRRGRKGGVKSFEVSFDSNGSVIGEGSFAGTTFGDLSRLSTGNTSFDYSMWEAPPGFTAHPSDSDSASDAPADRRVAQSKSETTGYLPLTIRVLGPALLHILHEEAFHRSTVYIPLSDRRKENGMTAGEVWARLGRLHERWERVQVAVVEDGLEDLEADGWVCRWGEGWWPTRSRL